MRRSEFDTILVGFVIGACFPILAFIVIQQVFELMASAGLIAENEGLTSFRRERTTYLFSIVACIIPVQILSRRRWDQALRGIMLPIFIYIGAWLYKYGSYLLSHF